MTYTLVQAWGTFGGGDGQFVAPWGVAVDGSGNVYVADPDNSRIPPANPWSDGTRARSGRGVPRRLRAPVVPGLLGGRARGLLHPLYGLDLDLDLHLLADHHATGLERLVPE